ncbi:MAG: hypothetical protein KJ077_11080 [Anaerolineae bacterium]|nr:hypothetical protein [Anaerolineae bacterium]
MAKRKRREPRPRKVQPAPVGVSISQRITNLMTELGTAATQVLVRDHQFTPEQVVEFLKQVQDRYALRTELALPALTPDGLLRDASVRFGLTAVEVLQENYSFTPEQSEAWLKALLEQGRQNRGRRVARKDPKRSGP